jgi:hypothetical protein
LGFRQGKTICIVGHLYFYTEQLLKVFLHRLAVHGCGIAILHGTQPGVMNTWRADPYPGWFYTGLFLHHVKQLFYLPQDVFVALIGFCGNTVAEEHFGIFGRSKDNAFHLCSAHINAPKAFFVYVGFFFFTHVSSVSVILSKLSDN